MIGMSLLNFSNILNNYGGGGGGGDTIDHFAAVSETEKRPDTILGEDKSQRNKHPHREW